MPDLGDHIRWPAISNGNGTPHCMLLNPPTNKTDAFIYLTNKMVSAYTQTTLNGNFNPKNASSSKSTNTNKLIFKILTNNILKDGLSQ